YLTFIKLGRSSPISPVLFLTVDGEPMRFFLRPGPTKVRLQPVIKAGGGLVCRAQEPGAFLLIDPEEMGSVAGSAAHWYVSTQYIRDCMEKNQQLEVEDYRFKPDNLHQGHANLSPLHIGRMGYTPEEDKAIMTYICEHKRESHGNKVWQEMAKNGLTCHSWQSMKDRYLKQLVKRQPEPRDGRGRNKTVITASGNEDDDDTPDLAEIAGPAPVRETQTPVAATQTENSSAQIQPQPAAQVKSSETQPEGQLPEATSPAMSGSAPNAPTVPNAPATSIHVPKDPAIPSTSTVPHLFLFERDSQQVRRGRLH
uniref:Telomeric repeat-binding factor 2-interacting protein 1 n=1 Tax=Oncorhynchus tshawytscha TaxID=74940 RepID=A0A8C8CHK8_ONCTS